MAELIYSNPEIYRINVPLTGNPLKNLNCYVIKDGGESAVIDTGFRMEECHRALMDGLHEIGVSPEHTKLLITHISVWQHPSIIRIPPFIWERQSMSITAG